MIAPKITGIALFFLLFVMACSEGNTDGSTDTFNKEAMLLNMAKNIIRPNYTTLQTSLETLDDALAIYIDSASVEQLQVIRTAFLSAYSNWQHCAVFEFGPAFDHQLRVNLNTFPTDITQIGQNIQEGKPFDLSLAANIDAKGFPALDYMLFGIANNINEVHYLLTLDELGKNRIDYIDALFFEVFSKVNTVANEWIAYEEVFTTSLGNDVGSSLGFLINELNYELEFTKNFKIGIPAGIKLDNPSILPEKLEGYYSQHNSSSFILANIKSVENIYLGRSNTTNIDGIGLNEYLIELDAQYNNTSLSDAIQARFTAAIEAIEAIENEEETMAELLTTNITLIETAYDKLQQLVVLLKTDMPSILGVSITYVEEGDTD